MALDADIPAITIIIDDIGYRTREDLRAIGLPEQVAYASNFIGQQAVQLHGGMGVTED